MVAEAVSRKANDRDNGGEASVVIICILDRLAGKPWSSNSHAIIDWGSLG